MKIERIDENTIKCFISFEEMEEKNVEYSDFITRTEKAQELMHEIIKQAHDEVGYKPPRFAFEMQIMMVPEQGMVLTFSEKEPFDIHDKGKVDAFLEHLKDFVGKLTDYKENIESKDAVDSILRGKHQAMAGSQASDMQGVGGQAGKGKSADNGGANGAASSKNTVGKDKTGKPVEICEAVFAFASLVQVMAFADALPANIRITSELYKMNGDYYMHISKGSASYDRYSKVCVVALEFAELYRADVGCDEMLKEHGECLIAEKAHKKLRK